MKPYERFYKYKKDFRDPFSRDRDRVIHCGSFRRLEYKTQVFLNHEGDYFRTRLTHSLEVSQIARTLARELGFNETLAETIALAHDLGHTPFGHVGGDELDRLLKEDGHKYGFDHNFQSYRVVSRLEKRYKEHDGLNLTYATQEGLLKHSYPYKKPFLDHLDKIFDFQKHPSVEAMIVDHADEIAYTTHDIDDGIKYALIDFDDIADLSLFKRATKQIDVARGSSLYRHRFVAGLIGLLVEDFIQNSKIKTLHIDKNSVQCASLGSDQPICVGFGKETSRELKELKKRLYKKLYRHEKIARKMHAGKECIKALYTAFKSDTDLLPPSQKANLKKRKKHRVISDYIADMTDRYAMKCYHEICGISF